MMMPLGSSSSAASPGVSTSKSSSSEYAAGGGARVSLRRERSADAIELIPGSGVRRCAPPSLVRVPAAAAVGRCAMVESLVGSAD